MTLSDSPKVILQDPRNGGQYLSEVPDDSNDIGCAIWSPHVEYAKAFTMTEVYILASGWPYLNACSVLPVPKGV